MHSSCILDSGANLLVRDMDFVGNVQNSLASFLKGLDFSFEFYCQGPALCSLFPTLGSTSQRESRQRLFST